MASVHTLTKSSRYNLAITKNKFYLTLKSSINHNCMLVDVAYLTKNEIFYMLVNIAYLIEKENFLYIG